MCCCLVVSVGVWLCLGLLCYVCLLLLVCVCSCWLVCNGVWLVLWCCWLVVVASVLHVLSFGCVCWCLVVFGFAVVCVLVVVGLCL